MKYAKPTMTLQIKGKPIIYQTGGSVPDTRPWALDVYGVHDDFYAPVEGGLGPQPLQDGTYSPSQYTPSFLPVVSRNQFYDPYTSQWRRMSGTELGIDVVPNMSRNKPSSYSAQNLKIAVNASTSTDLIPDFALSYLITVSVPAGKAIWLSMGADAEVGKGFRVSENVPFRLETPLQPAGRITAISEATSFDVGVLWIY